MEKVKAFLKGAYAAIKSTPMVFLYGVVIGAVVGAIFL